MFKSFKALPKEITAEEGHIPDAGHTIKDATIFCKSTAISIQSPTRNLLTEVFDLTTSLPPRKHIRPLRLTNMDVMRLMFFGHGNVLEKTNPTPSAALSSPFVN